MQTTPIDASRWLFLSGDGMLGRAALRALLSSGVRPQAVIAALPEAREAALDALRIADPGSIVELAAAAEVVVLRSARNDAAIAAAIEALRPRPTLAVIACLPVILRGRTLTLTRHGFINVHPSLLPAYRGPQPMFWQLRDGVARSGVSVHQVEQRVDAGPLWLQQDFELAAGISEADAESQAGRLAAELLAGYLRSWPPPFEPRAQGRAMACVQGTPDEAAYRIDAGHWPCERAWRFMRGVGSRGPVFAIHGPDFEVRASQALEYLPGAQQPQPRAEGGTVFVPFADGALSVRGQLRSC